MARRRIFRVDGFPGLKEALAELEDFTGKTTSGKNAVTRGLIKAMKPIESRAKDLAPTDSGKIRDSIRTKKARAVRGAGGRYQRQTSIEILTGPTGREEGGVGAYLEFGTVNMSARPFMRPAADAEADAVLSEVGRVVLTEVERTIDRARKRAARKG